jgi:hypothetical protein
MRIEFATGEALSYPLQLSCPGLVAITGCLGLLGSMMENEGNGLKVVEGKRRTIKFAVSL